jgi:hypothetical protein
VSWSKSYLETTEYKDSSSNKRARAEKQERNTETAKPYQSLPKGY